MKRLSFFTLLAAVATGAFSSEADSTQQRDLLGETTMAVEMSATAATGTFAPLWLTGNRYGLASVEPASAYARISAERPVELDAQRRWGIGYGLDVAAAAGHTRTFILQQAYVEGRYRALSLTLGAKQQPLETKDAALSSGGLSLGANARPIPQARLDIDWFAIPGTRGWWQWKLYGSFGFTTDGRWQKSWVDTDAYNARYTGNILHHEKALYWRFGRTDVFPLTYEIGLQMATQFGGTCYNVRGRGFNAPSTMHNSSDMKAFWNALTCRGSDKTDGLQANTAGNVLGSYVMALRYHGERWQARAYWERYFEDQSMLTVQYGIRDMLIGADVTLPRNRYIAKAALEFLTSTNQSGAVYHDRSANIPDKMNGRDEYLNHNIYAGWQHYGFGIGNPLLTAPLYNEALGHEGELLFCNNRVKAWHIALTGEPADEWQWRAMLTLSRNWGSYNYPLPDILRQTYAMAETTYTPRWARGWQATLALGLDHGKLLGNSFGGQLTIVKRLKIRD